MATKAYNRPAGYKKPGGTLLGTPAPAVSAIGSQQAPAQDMPKPQVPMVRTPTVTPVDPRLNVPRTDEAEAATTAAQAAHAQHLAESGYSSAFEAMEAGTWPVETSVYTPGWKQGDPIKWYTPGQPQGQQWSQKASLGSTLAEMLGPGSSALGEPWRREAQTAAAGHPWLDRPDTQTYRWEDLMLAGVDPNVTGTPWNVGGAFPLSINPATQEVRFANPLQAYSELPNMIGRDYLEAMRGDFEKSWPGLFDFGRIEAKNRGVGLLNQLLEREGDRLYLTGEEAGQLRDWGNLIDPGGSSHMGDELWNRWSNAALNAGYTSIGAGDPYSSWSSLGPAFGQFAVNMLGVVPTALDEEITSALAPFAGEEGVLGDETVNLAGEDLSLGDILSQLSGDDLATLLNSGGLGGYSYVPLQAGSAGGLSDEVLAALLSDRGKNQTVWYPPDEELEPNVQPMVALPMG